MSNIIVTSKWVIDSDHVIGKFCKCYGCVCMIIGFFGDSVQTTFLLEDIKTGKLKDRKIEVLDYDFTDQDNQDIQKYIDTKINPIKVEDLFGEGGYSSE